jgi:hypothetical protein
MLKRSTGTLLLLALALAPSSCSSRRSAPSLPLEMDLVAQGPAGSPPVVRLTFTNASAQPVSFEEPGPLCPGDAPEAGTRLTLVLKDASGRQSPFKPILTEHFRANLTAAESRTLAPGESWSAEYDLERLYFWGTNGQPMVPPISGYLVPDPTGMDLQAEVIPRGGTPIRSPSVHVPYQVGQWLFEDSGPTTISIGPWDIGPAAEERAREVERLHESADRWANSAAVAAARARDEQRRRESALQAARRVFSRLGKEPEHDGKPLSHWLGACSESRGIWTEPDPPASEREAREAVLAMGEPAGPFLLRVLEIEIQGGLNLCAADLLGNLFAAGKVPDGLLVETLKSGPVEIRIGVVKALDPGAHWLPGRRQPPALSSGLVEALVEILLNERHHFARDAVPSVLGRPGLKAAVPALTKALVDEDPSLRASAARALARIGPDAREALPALREMARASDRFERRTARSALIQLGEKLPALADFGERMAEYYHDRLAREPVREAAEVSLDRSPSGVDGVFFIVDNSGSSAEGFSFSQRYIPRVLASLTADDEFGIVFVAGDAIAHPGGGRPARAGNEEKSAASAFVLGAEGGHGSCLAAGFTAAFTFAEAARAGRKAIIYIGDGGGTCTGPEEEYLERLCEEVTRRNAGRVAIHALGVNPSALGEAVLLYLTEKNGGTYTRLVE